MKFTLSWLREHLDTDWSVAALARTLTAIGLEVESIDNPADKLFDFRIARVLSAAPHPQADKLQVLSVDAGQGPLQVVCGAPNARAGLTGVFGAPGATVPANGMVLKVASIRGVESNGMMCSARELELGDSHEGIIELPADAPIGQSYALWAGLDDPLFDIAITPNRQDCLSVRGIARDLAAAGAGVLRPLAEVYRLAVVEPVIGTGPGPDVATQDAVGCPAFYAQAVSGVTNGASPAWMAEKLLAIGQKPISLLVDITNFVSTDLGRPLHVYDRATLCGPLVARLAREGEQVRALNGKTYALAGGMTVIADDVQVHDIAGIMGGMASGVSTATSDVLIECAFFDPAAIARTGQKLGLTSDARQRFERGVDPAFLDDGLAIATRLVRDHGGGTASGVTRAGQPPNQARTLSYDPGLCATLGGLPLSIAEQSAILTRLGFANTAVEATLVITVPSWRRDIGGVADIVEEVIRVAGLDQVQSMALPRADGVARATATPAQALERRVRRAAAARGANEAVTWSFIPPADAELFAIGNTVPWVLSNPISEEMKAMRPSLLPGLLAAARRNLDRGVNGLRLFEIGRRYLAGAAGRSDERLTLGLVLAGERTPRGWASGRAAAFDAYDAKAEALALLAEAGAPVDRLQVMGEAGGQFHPGQSATLRLGPQTVLARFGMIHPAIARHFDIKVPVAMAELFVDAVPAKKAGGDFARAGFAPPALQPVTRDFAFLVPAAVPAADLLRAVRGSDKAHIIAARVFDDFRDGGVAEGHKSLAIEVTLQPGGNSFDEAALKAIAGRIVAAAGKLGAALRG